MYAYMYIAVAMPAFRSRIWKSFAFAEVPSFKTPFPYLTINLRSTKSGKDTTKSFLLSLFSMLLLCASDNHLYTLSSASPIR